MPSLPSFGSTLAALALGVMAGALPATAAPETYALDPVHSSVTFSAKTLFTPIHGSFLLAEGGTLVFDAADLSTAKVEATIPLNSVNTRNEYRDKNITSKPGWFAAAEYPTARYVSKQWRRTGEKTYAIVGDFTLNGVTREITLAAEHLGSGPGLEPGTVVTGWTATVTINRTVFGVTADPGVISPTIPITLALQGVRKEPAAKP